jgi:hypothetical protein
MLGENRQIVAKDLTFNGDADLRTNRLCKRVSFMLLLS